MVASCKHRDVGLEKCAEGPHWGKRVCNDCNAFIKWEPKPFVTAWDSAMPMPFGKHKGVPLHQLPDEYCRWLHEQDVHRGLQEYLKQRIGK